MNYDRVRQMIESLANSEATPAISAIRDLTKNLPDAKLIEEHLKTLEEFVTEVDNFGVFVETELIV